MNAKFIKIRDSYLEMQKKRLEEMEKDDVKKE